MQGPYQEHVLDAPDVCCNCLRKNRVERVDPQFADEYGTELDSHYSRDRRETTVDYHDGGDRPTQAKGVWCRCGVEGSHERIWDPDDVDRDRFKRLLKNLARTLERKQLTVRRKTLFSYALGYYDETDSVDNALRRATDAAIGVAASSDTKQHV